MLDKKTVLAIILTIAFFTYTVYDNHNLDMSFTSFYLQSDVLKTNYTITSNKSNSFIAEGNKVISDYIILSEDSDTSNISVHTNGERIYKYQISNNNIELKNVVDTSNNVLCFNSCSGYLQLEEFIVRGRVINELEKLY